MLSPQSLACRHVRVWSSTHEEVTAMREEQEQPSKRYAVSVHQIAEMWTEGKENWCDFIAVRSPGVAIPYRLYRRSDPPSGPWRRVIGIESEVVATEVQDLLDVLWFNGKSDGGV